MSQDDYSADGCPAVFHSVGPGEHLKRVDVFTPALAESDIQELLRLHPQLLPISEIEPGFSPCCCFGREVRVGSGRLDNLYISPAGNLTLVETKLWKNPQARREVVGQIVDYARHMAAWDYTQLETVAKDYFQKYGIDSPSLYKWLKKKFGDQLLPEDRFIDTVNSSLTGGRFLLLIVGDGIREGVQEMVEYLQATPQLRFRLALVELQCFRSGGKKWPLTIVPRALSKTVEIERAVVRVEMTSEAAKQVKVTTTVPPVSPSGSSSGSKVDLTREAFLENLRASTDDRTAAKVDAFVTKSSKIAGLEVQIQQQILFDWVPEKAAPELAERLLVINHAGFLRPPKRKPKDVVSPQLQRYWDELGRIHPDLPVRRSSSGKFTTKRVNLSEVVNKLDAITDAMANYAKACESEEQAVVT